MRGVGSVTSAYRQFVIDRGRSRVLSYERKGSNRFVNRACGQRLGQVQICINHLCKISSAEEHLVYTEGAGGSNPSSCTRFMKKCGKKANVNYRDECDDCERKRKRDEDDDDRRRRDSDDAMMMAAIICCLS